MQVSSLSILDIFSRDVHHVVPLYQRPYVWQHDTQWVPLWDEVSRNALRTDSGSSQLLHFLGASVQEVQPTPAGHSQNRLVIDGQQRLITIQLLLKAFADVVSQTNISVFDDMLRNLTRNNNPLCTEDHEQFKIWPTYSDQEHFRNTLQAGSRRRILEKYDCSQDATNVGNQIVDCYLFFSSAVSTWLNSGTITKQRIGDLFSSICGNIHLVVIDLDNNFDSQLVFEILNARGSPLLVADLLKNYLLQKARDNGENIDDLYIRLWKRFDEYNGYWRDDIGRGHTKRPRIDVFLQHYLTMMTKKEVQASRLYYEFRCYSDDNRNTSAVKHLMSINKYADIYRRIDRNDENQPTCFFIERLATMEVGTAYPFLLELFHSLKAKPVQLQNILQDLDSFLVRRMVCRHSTRAYNRVFFKLLVALVEKSGDVDEIIRNELLAGKADIDIWPDDAAFSKAWNNNQLYKNLTRARLRMLLESLEREMRRGSHAETMDVPRKLTIEHIMPRSWMEHWPLPPEHNPDIARKDREHLIETIGNLTLLSQSLNPSISNGPWTSDERCKKSAIADNTVLFLNKQLDRYEYWSEETIANRASSLFDLALSIWHRPSD